MFNKKEIAPGIMIYSDVMNNHKEFIPAVEHFMELNNPEIFWSDSYVYKDGESIIDKNRSSKTYFVNYHKTNNDVFSQKNLF